MAAKVFFGLRIWVLSHTAVAVGLLAAVGFTGATAGYLALIQPPYRHDEHTHLGYSLRLREGTLPTISTPVPTEGGGPELLKALERPFPYSGEEIHVANNPPFVYLAGIPLGELSDRAGLRGGGLFGLRLLDLTGAAAAVIFAFLLGRELAGGDDHVGLATAGIMSGIVTVNQVVSVANQDGPALMGTTAVTWALARLVRTRTANHALALGLWCAVAAAVRPMALAYAAAAGLVALVWCSRERGLRALPAFAVRIGAPTVLLTGWFYALNHHRYGDFTGSRGLFEMFGTAPGPPMVETLFSKMSFVTPLHYMLVETYGTAALWEDKALERWAVASAAVLLVAIAIFLARQPGSRSGSRGGALRSPSAAAWASVAIVGAVPILLVAKHLSGGGAGHPRYLMPMLPIFAAACSFTLSRIDGRLAVVTVAGFAASQLLRLRGIGDRYRQNQLFGPELSTPLASEWTRDVAFALAWVAAAVLLACLMMSYRRTRAS